MDRAGEKNEMTMNIHVRIALIFVASTVRLDIAIIVYVQFLERVD